jgi:tetratricopeptide (TPR) repeat protein
MFQKGERISKYEIRQELGGGYFGTTYRAFDTITQTDVALKVISNLKHFNFESFAREARMLFELHHPNIIKYFESNFFTLRGRKIYYIAMEYAQRGTLRDVMNNFDVEKSAEVTMQILRGMEVIHSKGILHSDLKPDNILIDAGSTIKISDFGVAKMGVGTHYFGSPAGSPLYMAPEQFLKGKTSVRTDIWSIGVIFYELLYKKRPYENIQEIIDKEFHPHYSNGTELEKHINEFMRVCLQREEEKRFQNIAEMIEFFENHILVSIGSKKKAAPPVVSEKLTAEGYFQKGLEFSSIGDADRAVAYYTEAIKEDGGFAMAYYNRAMAKSEKGLFKESLEDFTQCIHLKPGFGDAYVGRGNAYLSVGNPDKAIDDYDEALIHNPADPDVYYNRGVAYDQLEEYDMALADYSEAIALKPEFAQAFNNRAICHDRNNDRETSIADFTEALICKAGFSDAFLGRGNAYFRMGDTERAIADFTQALMLKPDDAEGFYNRAYAYEEKESLEKALADYTKAIELKPHFVEAYTNRGLILKKMGREDEAAEDFLKARNYK